MSLYIDICNRLKAIAEEDTSVNGVTKGVHIETQKTEASPKVHIRVDSAEVSESITTFQVAIFAMSLRGHNNVPRTDNFSGYYQEDNNLDSMLDVISGIYLKLVKREENFVGIGNLTIEPFYDDYMNNWDGWVGTFSIQVENNVGIC